MKIRLLHVLLLSVAGWTVAAMIGCGDSDPFNADKPRRGPAMGVGGSLAPVDLDTSKGTVKPPPPAPAASTNPPATGAVPPPPPPPPPPSTANAAPSPPPPGPPVERTEAGVGVETRKGHGYGGGLISTSIAAYFSVQERIAFDQVLYAMKLYKAENGRGPKSNEEFMEVIIKENMIKLPELRSPEHRYVYDPKTEELMVEQPK